ncbi:MAG: hypothetical protein COB15_06390 [Flavobacteriales bacterium]|nr:MAG: hypothetical protein COB15_06390 [Flavobacteriales bacterium]
MITQLLTILIIASSQPTYSVLEKNKIECSKNGCSGTYTGPEFINGSDVAHQFSNKMSKEVGDKLKELYSKGEYSKVDFSNIKMSTKGMGSGNVIYKLSIPFIRVKEKCDSYTSFDHVGGWNHSPALTARKTQLKNVLMKGEKLVISNLKTTPEGLQEYWIQWKNKVTQASCND